MMTRWKRLLPMLFAALWLPLQAAAGIAMPFCRHAADAVAAPAAAPEAHCHHEDAAPAAPQAAGDCDQCGICHFASAGFLPPALPSAAGLPPARDFAAQATLASPSHIPDPPRHPPKRSS